MERVKGGESRSGAETESGAQKEVSSECVYTTELNAGMSLEDN